MADIADKIVVSMGYKNVVDFGFKYLLPLLLTVIVSFLLLIFFLSSLPFYIPYAVLLIGILFVILYPIIIFEKKKNDINSKLHLFITFAGAVATMDIQRGIFFKKMAEKESFGEISQSMKRIIYLAKSWNIGYANACRRIGKLSPSKSFGDFLDRLAIMMDFGEPLKQFLHDEQNAVMDDYAVEYQKSLERIKTIQEIFTALTLALAFMITIGMLLPLISGESIAPALYGMLAVTLLLDAGIFFFINSFIPSDDLIHNLKVYDKDSQKLHKSLLYTIPLSAITFLVLFYYSWFSLITTLGIAIVPMFISGVLAQNIEDAVFKRDKSYPTFIRALGSAVEIRSGAVLSSLYALQVHDFGDMNDMAVNLYRRLRTGSDKEKSWLLFGAESGSNLIVQFTNIFQDAVTLGGSAERIGEIISENFIKLLALRKQKIQLSSVLRGGLYGSLAGMAIAGYIAAQITVILGNILSAPTNDFSGAGQLGDVIGNLAPGEIAVDLDLILLIIGIILIAHSVVSGLIIKKVEGGHPYAAFFDIAIMVWMCVVLSIIIPMSIKALLPGLLELTPQ